MIKLINGREHVIAAGITRHRGLVAGARLPAAMEVVGHHVVEIDVGIDSLQIEIGQLVGAASGGDGDLIALAIALLQPIELLAQQLQSGLKVGAVINADGIASGTATTGVFPVEINGGDEAVLLQRVDHIAGEGLPTSGIVKRQAEFIGERPTTEGDAKVQLGVELFEQLQLAQVAGQGTRGVPVHRHRLNSDGTISSCGEREITTRAIALTAGSLQPTPLSR